ncbi:hypothetical protein [Burkholderia ubonensis]|uniref:hypothetical protein n=1 Tax=Burkholderia ubonensis TaxID=101571 RepID=UPI0012FBA742|nr:hypothetical protein [Burkholderia ubonensis]
MVSRKNAHKSLLLRAATFVVLVSATCTGAARTANPKVTAKPTPTVSCATKQDVLFACATASYAVALCLTHPEGAEKKPTLALLVAQPTSNGSAIAGVELAILPTVHFVETSEGAKSTSASISFETETKAFSAHYEESAFEPTLASVSITNKESRNIGGQPISCKGNVVVQSLKLEQFTKKQ